MSSERIATSPAARVQLEARHIQFPGDARELAPSGRACMKEAARMAIAALDHALKAARTEAVWLSCLLLWALAFFVDLVTPQNLRLVLAYLPSVALATWYIGPLAGGIFAVASVAARIVDQCLLPDNDTLVSDALDALLLGGVLTLFIPMLSSTRGHLSALDDQSRRFREALR